MPLQEYQVSDDADLIRKLILSGHVFLRIHEHADRGILYKVKSLIGLRKTNDTENEFSVVGPKIGFTEDLDTNLHLMRTQVNIPNLVIKEVTSGKISHSRIAILYIDGLTNEQIVATVEQRIKALDFTVIFDSTQLDQLITDNSNTPFPLLLNTERRDRVTYSLIRGQVAVISDGSPYFIIGPSTLFDFFISPEDYYLPWVIGSFFRIIRIFGVIFSIIASSMYVAIMTFHYEVIPQDMLKPLIYSRLNVPFDPVLEVLFLELIIEFVREAGARLPSKIGQTLGIVGGIIVGTAAVEAALASNILIIVVCLSALASFTTPIYKMSNTIRFLRFPIILLAAYWGSLGIFIGVCFLLVHVTRLTSLGFPYMVPLFPFRPGDFSDSFIRSDYEKITDRPGFLRTQHKKFYNPKPWKRQKEWDDDE
nr:spore germination protein [Paenibacillus swuensis]